MNDSSLTPQQINSTIAAVAKRSAIHFVLTGIDATFEAEIGKLIAAQKLVILHLPPGMRVNLDCAIRHYRVE